MKVSLKYKSYKLKINLRSFEVVLNNNQNITPLKFI